MLKLLLLIQGKGKICVGRSINTMIAVIPYFNLFWCFTSASFLDGYLRYLTIVKVEMQINTQLIAYKNNAPKKNLKFPVAKPKPAVHSGGINAVAMATPGIGLPFSTRVIAITPTKPPKKAISTS